MGQDCGPVMRWSRGGVERAHLEQHGHKLLVPVRDGHHRAAARLVGRVVDAEAVVVVKQHAVGGEQVEERVASVVHIVEPFEQRRGRSGEDGRF